MKRLISLIFLTGLTVGCSDEINSASANMNTNHPSAVARSFWNVHFSDTNKLPQQLTMSESITNRFQNLPKESEPRVVLGSTVEQNSLYFINSTLQFVDKGKLVSIPFMTVVGSKSGGFRVDYNATVNSFFDTIIQKKTEEIGRLLKYTELVTVKSIPSQEGIMSESYNFAKGEFDNALSNVGISEVKAEK